MRATRPSPIRPTAVASWSAIVPTPTSPGPTDRGIICKANPGTYQTVGPGDSCRSNGDVIILSHDAVASMPSCRLPDCRWRYNRMCPNWAQRDTRGAQDSPGGGQRKY